MVWRRDATSDSFHPGGRIADFTAVQALSMVPQHGLVEVRLADGGSGFIDASRLTPGDRRKAQQAYCAFNAGAPPRNGEVLSRRGQGSARLAISNRSDQPAVVKLRDASGRSIASVFLEPSGATEVGLPNGVYRPDFALGEIWSRACDSFTAGMRAQRFAGYGSVPGLSPLVILARYFHGSRAGRYSGPGVRAGFESALGHGIIACRSGSDQGMTGGDVGERRRRGCNHRCTQMHTDKKRTGWCVLRALHTVCEEPR